MNRARSMHMVRLKYPPAPKKEIWLGNLRIHNFGDESVNERICVWIFKETRRVDWIHLAQHVT